MASPNDEAAVQFYFALHDGTPVLIGAGSHTDVQRVSAEAQQIDAETGSPKDGSARSAGTRHFYLELGRLAGVEHTTVAAMALYDELVAASREAYLEKLRSPDQS